MDGRTRIKVVLAGASPGDEVTVKGWLRTVRVGKEVTFLAVNDGSCFASLQVVAEPVLANYDEVCRLGTGAAVAVRGLLVASPAAGQEVELRAQALEVVGQADESYPLQKKRHSFEYLRTIAHLRPRTNTFGAVFRVRSMLAQAVHRFFAERDFLYVQTPIITTSDCEGAGELFRVTTLDLANLPLAEGAVDFNADFFGEAAGLTVSGQLEGELFAQAFSD
ncbi:MAG TPA: OB-fold nucleic acid binding domain-containing protein, partial [Geobacteraceae bacterium]